MSDFNSSIMWIQVIALGVFLGMLLAWLTRFFVHFFLQALVEFLTVMWLYAIKHGIPTTRKKYTIWRASQKSRAEN